MIVGVTGMPGSGKTTVAKMLSDKGFALVEMGEIVRREVIRGGLEPNRKNMQYLSHMLRRRYGSDIVARKSVAIINRFRGKNAVVSGIRSVSEARYLKANARMVLIGVVAPPKLRYARLRKRSRRDDPKNFKEFLAREKFEAGLGAKAMLGLADFIIANTATTAALRSDVSSLIKGISEKENKSY